MPSAFVFPKYFNYKIIMATTMKYLFISIENILMIGFDKAQPALLLLLVKVHRVLQEQY